MVEPEKLKSEIRKIAKEKNLSSQEVLQMFLFERVMERLSRSRYRKNFILKGGFLIASMISVGERTTMDIDTTIKGIPMEENILETAIREILSIDAGDGIVFYFDRIEPIREKDEYNNYRVHFSAKYGRMNNPMKMDLTTGDAITPGAIRYKYRSFYDGKTIDIYAYNLETILAEKYETIIRRNIGNTRVRDFYDLYSLYSTYEDRLDVELLKKAVIKTSRKRDSLEKLLDWESIIEDISNESSIRQMWSLYQNEYKYAKKIGFNDLIDLLRTLGTIINK